MRFSRRVFALTLAMMLVFGSVSVAVASAAVATEEPVYTLSEEVIIREDDTPLGIGPTEKECCIMHFFLMLCALCVTVYYTYDRKKRQEREFELRAELR